MARCSPAAVANPHPKNETMAKINGNEVRPGMAIMHQDRLWVAVKVDHVKPGKGGAYAQVELKAILGGTKLNERFRSAGSPTSRSARRRVSNCDRLRHS